MKTYKIILGLAASLLCVMGCTDSLDISPKQVLDESYLVKPEDMEGFVTAAYARMTDIPSFVTMVVGVHACGRLL